MNISIEALKEQIKEKPQCCEKDMIELPNQNMLDDTDRLQYTCLECGTFFCLSEGQLDEEELDNIKDNYGDD